MTQIEVLDWVADKHGLPKGKFEASIEKRTNKAILIKVKEGYKFWISKKLFKKGE